MNAEDLSKMFYCLSLMHNYYTVKINFNYGRQAKKRVHLRINYFWLNTLKKGCFYLKLATVCPNLFSTFGKTNLHYFRDMELIKLHTVGSKHTLLKTA